MAESNNRIVYILPRGDDFLREVTRNILFNIRKTKDATVILPSVVARAHTIVNEAGVLPVRDYTGDDKLILK